MTNTYISVPKLNIWSKSILYIYPSYWGCNAFCKDYIEMKGVCGQLKGSFQVVKKQLLKELGEKSYQG
jgi:hypothetical protein